MKAFCVSDFVKPVSALAKSLLIFCVSKIDLKAVRFCLSYEFRRPMCFATHLYT